MEFSRSRTEEGAEVGADVFTWWVSGAGLAPRVDYVRISRCTLSSWIGRGGARTLSTPGVFDEHPRPSSRWTSPRRFKTLLWLGRLLIPVEPKLSNIPWTRVVRGIRTLGVLVSLMTLRPGMVIVDRFACLFTTCTFVCLDIYVILFYILSVRFYLVKAHTSNLVTEPWGVLVLHSQVLSLT